MSENESDIVDAIRVMIWAGLSSPEDAQQLIEDLHKKGDSNEEMLRGLIALEFSKKASEEKTWPSETDCDRLDAVFERLNKSGFIALHIAGCTMSDGHSEIDEVYLQREKTDNLVGYCFYHGQDLLGAVDGEGLYLAFGDFNDTPEGKLAVGKAVKAALAESGFAVEWENDPESRIYIPNFEWKRRSRKR